jgi:hypothetical protein
MLRWFQALMPREDRFFDLYNRHARILVQGAEALQEVRRKAPTFAELIVFSGAGSERSLVFAVIISIRARF